MHVFQFRGVTDEYLPGGVSVAGIDPPVTILEILGDGTASVRSVDATNNYPLVSRANQAITIFLADKVMHVRKNAVSYAPAELARQTLGQHLGFELPHIRIEEVLPFQVVRFNSVIVYQYDEDITFNEKPA
jgi:hypothetical protein